MKLSHITQNLALRICIYKQCKPHYLHSLVMPLPLAGLLPTLFVPCPGGMTVKILLRHPLKAV